MSNRRWDNWDDDAKAFTILGLIISLFIGSVFISIAIGVLTRPAIGFFTFGVFVFGAGSYFYNYAFGPHSTKKDIDNMLDLDTEN